MYKQKEIVLVPFPYSDLSSSKRRPVLIVSNNYYNKHFQDVVVCVITSNLLQDGFSVELNDEHFTSGVLPEPSIIKCHKLFTIEQRQILKRFSIITDKKFKEVILVLQELIEE